VCKKDQDCARFAQKTIARKAKILQTPPYGRQTGVFLRLFHLFFGSPNEVDPSS